MVGVADGLAVGLAVGPMVVGVSEGLAVGLLVVGVADGLAVGVTVGLAVGLADGLLVGDCVGLVVGLVVVAAAGVVVVKTAAAGSDWLRSWVCATLPASSCPARTAEDMSVNDDGNQFLSPEAWPARDKPSLGSAPVFRMVRRPAKSSV